MTMNTELRAAIKFFAEHGAYCTPPGRMACAKKHALAEARAKEEGLVFSWIPEYEPWDGEPPAPRYLECAIVSTRSEREGTEEWCQRHGHTPHYNFFGHGLVCSECQAPAGRTLASLGMIGTDSRTDPYRRVVEAQLAVEALEILDAERDEIATRNAEELAGRATFALIPHSPLAT
jgi:hypothetical protein